MTPWRRTFWVVFFANLITAVGMMSFLPFFPTLLSEELGVVDESLRAVWAGVLFGAAPLAAAVMGPIWGSIGDRFGRKLMVLRALLAIALFVGLMGLAQNPWQLLALRLGQGVFSGFVPPSITLVSVVTPRDNQGRVTSALQTSLPAGMITGPLAGEWIQSHYGMRAVFLFVACAATLAALGVGLFASEDANLRATVERFSPTSVLATAARDMRELLQNPNLRLSLTVLFCVQFGLGATNPLLQIFVEDIWAGDPERVERLTAWLFSSMAVAGLVATPLWGHVGDRIGHARALTLAALATALALALHATAGVYWGLFLARIGVGLSAPGANTAAFGVAATETRGDRRGGAFGAVFSARALAVSLGAVSGGLLASILGMRGLFLSAGLAVGCLLALRELRRTAAHDAPRSELPD